MRSFLLSYLFCSFFIVQAFSRPVIISGHVPSGVKDSLILSGFLHEGDMLMGLRKVASAAPDKSGYFHLQVEMAGPRQLTLSLGDRMIFPFTFLMPGDSVFADIHADTAQFSGKGSISAAYALRADDREKGTGWERDKPAFMAYNDSVREDELAYLYKYVKDSGLDNNLAEAYRQHILYKLAEYRQTYLSAHFFMMGKEGFFQPSKAYLDSIDRWLTPSKMVYSHYLFYYLRNKIFSIYYIQKMTEKDPKKQAAMQGNYLRIGAALADTIKHPLTRALSLAVVLKDEYKDGQPSLEKKKTLDSLLQKLANLEKPAGLTNLYAPLNKAIQDRYRMLGKNAPDITLKDTNGNTVRLKDLKGKVVLVDFWGTWCGPCIRSIPMVNALQDSLKGRKDFVVLTVCVDCPESHWKQALAETHYQGLHLLNDKAAGIVEKYDLKGYPTYALIDKKGRLQSLPAGSPGYGVLEPVLARLLAE